jgi:transcriptional regulator with XRE-family HTH domain
MEVNIIKAELARKLKVSPAYITMISQGKRTPSKKLQRKINRLGLTNSLNNLNGVQVVVGSNPTAPTIDKRRDFLTT